MPNLLLQVAQELQNLVEGGPLCVLVAEAGLHRERKREWRIWRQMREVWVCHVLFPLALGASGLWSAQHANTMSHILLCCVT